MMMNKVRYSDLYPLLRKYWREEIAPDQPPPEAKFRTGKPEVDSQLHLLETKYGISVIISDNKVSDYDIVDPNKYTLFLLKWS